MVRPRVLILNNYPMDRVLREVEILETPDQALFGVNKLQDYGFDVTFLPFPALGFWSGFQGFLMRLHLPLELGDLQQQIIALRMARNADIIYAPCGSQTHLLQYLHAVGFLRLPIVTLMHHPFPRGKLDILRSWQRRLFVNGASRIPCLSKTVVRVLKEYGAPDKKLVSLKWGTDLDFYGPWTQPGSGVIAAGRTGRDFKTFVQAVKLSRCNATLIGLQGQLDDPIFGSTPQLKIIEARNEQPVPGENRGWIKYPELCYHMRSHSALAIPLFAQNSLAGLTSLMDGLGLGRAILMTRNPYIDLDIEVEGIGFWLQPGDVNGWVRCLNWVHDNPLEVASMGKRSRYLAEQSYNSGSFAGKIASILHSALAESRGT